MATQLKNACCTCAGQVSACVCSDITCSMVCRQKNSVDLGDAELCGFAEYIDPSNPPKFFRRQTVNKDYVFCSYPLAAGGCLTTFGSAITRHQQDGAYCQFDADDCSQTTSGTRHFGGAVNSAGAPCEGSPVLTAEDESTNACDNLTVSDPIVPPIGFTPSFADPQHYELQSTGSCYLSGAGTDYGFVISGTWTFELSDEDSEDDAEGRAAAGGDWGICGLGCGPTCSAFRTSRIDDAKRKFSWRKVQVQVSFTAVVDHSYTVTVRFFRRPLGSGGGFIFASLTEVTVTADNVSEQTDWIDVPNEEGMETIAGNCTVVAIP